MNITKGLNISIDQIKKDTEYVDIIEDLIKNTKVQELKNFIQHCDTSRFEHCVYVSYYSYCYCKKKGLNYKAAARGGILHDLFLYDWRNSSKQLNLGGLHAFVHPKIALENAQKLFLLTDMEKDIIRKHMWPVTLSLPRYKESFVVTVADKYSAFFESFNYFLEKFKTRKVYRYASIIISFILLRI